MRISTDYSAIAGLTSLFDAMSASATPTAAGTSTSGFGPAALLALGQQTTTAPATFDYTTLLQAATQLHSPATVAVSPKQQEQEQEITKQAAVLRVNGRFDEARALLEKLLEQNPSSGPAVHGLGAIELDLENYQKAEQLFYKAHHMAPQYGFDRDAINARTLQRDDEYALEQAQWLTRSDDTRNDGVRLLVALTHRSPSNAIARTLLAENLILQGSSSRGLAQYQLAISSAGTAQLVEIESKLQHLAEIAPEAAYVRNLLGQTELKLGKHAQAAETLALASQLGEYAETYLADEALAHVALGHDALDSGDVRAALRAFKYAESLDPTGDRVRSGLAEGYMASAQSRLRIGDPERAVDDLLAARNLLTTVDDDDLKAELASAFYSVGRRLESRRISAGEEVGTELAAFQAAYELDNENLTYANKLAETHNTVGDEYLAEGDYKSAAYAYQAAYEISSSDADYQQSAIDAFLAWGDERSDARDHYQAIRAYQAAYDLDQTNETSKSSLADAFNTRGVFYRSLGDDFYSQAADDFLAALDLYPDNPDYQDNYDSVT